MTIRGDSTQGLPRVSFAFFTAKAQADSEGSGGIIVLDHVSVICAFAEPCDRRESLSARGSSTEARDMSSYFWEDMINVCAGQDGFMRLQLHFASYEDLIRFKQARVKHASVHKLERYIDVFCGETYHRADVEVDIWRTWRSVMRPRHSAAYGPRLENLAWRMWGKQRYYPDDVRLESVVEYKDRMQSSGSESLRHNPSIARRKSISIDVSRTPDKKPLGPNTISPLFALPTTSFAPGEPANPDTARGDIYTDFYDDGKKPSRVYAVDFRTLMTLGGRLAFYHHIAV
ncbi:hypothetical protein BC629DRAFT_1434219 [Irpex lacteus]|nr:hypothetical protein BC629DRAFT_1434219 [Irpex lacteus]